MHLVFISVIILNSLFACYGGCAKKHAKSEGFYLIVGCVIGLLDFQEDGDKKIDLAPGHFMEHDQDVWFLPFLVCMHYVLSILLFVRAKANILWSQNMCSSTINLMSVIVSMTLGCDSAEGSDAFCMLSSYGDVWGQFGFFFILTKMKSLPGCRWEQWLWDLIGTSITTNFSESTSSFLAFSCCILGWCSPCSFHISWYTIGQGVEGESVAVSWKAVLVVSGVWT